MVNIRLREVAGVMLKPYMIKLITVVLLCCGLYCGGLSAGESGGSAPPALRPERSATTDPAKRLIELQAELAKRQAQKIDSPEYDNLIALLEKKIAFRQKQLEFQKVLAGRRAGVAAAKTKTYSPEANQKLAALARSVINADQHSGAPDPKLIDNAGIVTQLLQSGEADPNLVIDGLKGRIQSGPLIEVICDYPVRYRFSSDIFQVLLKVNVDPSPLLAKNKISCLVNVPELIDAGWPEEFYKSAFILNMALSLKMQKLSSRLIESGCNVNWRAYDGKTPMHVAAENNMTSAIELLLIADADPDALDKKGDTPLVLAAFNANAESMDILLAAGADPARLKNTKAVSLEQARTQAELAKATKTGDAAKAKQAVKDGADPYRKKEFDSTPLYKAVRLKKYTMAEELLASGVDPNQDYSPPLALAVCQNDFKMFQMLLQYYANPNVSVGYVEGYPISNSSVLHYLCYYSKNKLEFIREILNYNVNLENNDNGKELPIFYCIAPNYNLEAVKLLVNAGADVNKWNKRGDTLLMAAIRNQPADIDLVRVLLNANAKADAKVNPRYIDRDEFSVLHVAAAAGASQGVFEALLTAKADPRAVTRSGKTIFDAAKDDKTRAAMTAAMQKLKIVVDITNQGGKQ